MRGILLYFFRDFRISKYFYFGCFTVFQLKITLGALPSFN
nr:MAG TPA: hypothetical protein [Caudoviricetes sp.]